MTTGSGTSVGLPMPRSMMSTPSRRFRYLRSLILPNRYGGRRRTRSATLIWNGVWGVLGSLCIGGQGFGVPVYFLFEYNPWQQTLQDRLLVLEGRSILLVKQFRQADANFLGVAGLDDRRVAFLQELAL